MRTKCWGVQCFLEAVNATYNPSLRAKFFIQRYFIILITIIYCDSVNNITFLVRGLLQAPVAHQNAQLPW